MEAMAMPDTTRTLDTNRATTHLYTHGATRTPLALLGTEPGHPDYLRLMATRTSDQLLAGDVRILHHADPHLVDLQQTAARPVPNPYEHQARTVKAVTLHAHLTNRGVTVEDMRRMNARAWANAANAAGVRLPSATTVRRVIDIALAAQDTSGLTDISDIDWDALEVTS